jgi:hypothetical protein
VRRLFVWIQDCVLIQRTSTGSAEGVKGLRIVDKEEGMLREGRGGRGQSRQKGVVTEGVVTEGVVGG